MRLPVTNPQNAVVRDVIWRALAGAVAKLRQPRSRKSRAWLLMPIVTMSLLLLVKIAAQTRSAGEYEVKAAFLFNFAKFVEWPPGAFSGTEAPIHLCVLGEDPFAGTLEQVVQNKAINGRRLQVEHLQAASEARSCHILFVSSLDGKADRAMLRAGYGPGVLTVGDASGFAVAGGVIDFVEEQNRVAFEVNLDAAVRAKVKISSKLLSLARIVHDDPSLGNQ